MTGITLPPAALAEATTTALAAAAAAVGDAVAQAVAEALATVTIVPVDLDATTAWTPTNAAGGRLRRFSSADPITVTLGDLADGVLITMVQAGTGQISVVAEAPTTLRSSVTGHDKSSNQWATISALKVGADWILTGDTDV